MIKQLQKIGCLLAVAIFAFTSCKKDEVQTIATKGTQPVLSSTASSLNYTEADSANPAVTYSWTTSDFGYAAAINYTLEVSYKGTNFAKTSSFGMGTSLTTSFKVKDLNTVALNAKYLVGQQDTLYARIKAAVTDSLYQYSNVVKLILTPYLAKRVIPYPLLYLPGAYQGWSPGAAVIAKLYSPTKNNKYEGYIYLTDPVNEFKITPAPVWDNSFGMLTSTTMAYNGGSNFSIAGAGYYLLKVDTTAKTWSAVKTNWAMIGDFNGWGADLAMDFDPVNQVFTKTLSLPVGGFKFRANADWGTNIGAGGVYGGGNIPITTAGVYQVILDLRVPSEVMVTVIQQ